MGIRRGAPIPSVLRLEVLFLGNILFDRDGIYGDSRGDAQLLTMATHPEGPLALPATNQYLRWGSSPRGAQSMALAAKVQKKAASQEVDWRTLPGVDGAAARS